MGDGDSTGGWALEIEPMDWPSGYGPDDPDTDASVTWFRVGTEYLFDSVEPATYAGAWADPDGGLTWPVFLMGPSGEPCRLHPDDVQEHYAAGDAITLLCGDVPGHVASVRTETDDPRYSRVTRIAVSPDAGGPESEHYAWELARRG